MKEQRRDYSPPNISEGRRVEFKVVVKMIFVLISAAIVTLHSVDVMNPDVPEELYPMASPYGYTYSLALWFFPFVALGLWVFRHLSGRLIEKKAYLLTSIILVTLGMLLDILFGLTFFNFPNEHATLGLKFWGFKDGLNLVAALPIEEAGFYLFGILSILTVYVWADLYWCHAYSPAPPDPGKVSFRQTVRVDWQMLVWAAVLFVLAYGYKKFLGPVEYRGGFPGYFLFLTVTAVTPLALFLRMAIQFINWRAFSMTFLFTMLVSLFWEAALALPYGWWNYNPESMLGISIRGLSNLPIEEPILWMAASITTVVVFETLNVWLHILNWEELHRKMHPRIHPLLGLLRRLEQQLDRLLTDLAYGKSVARSTPNDYEANQDRNK